MQGPWFNEDYVSRRRLDHYSEDDFLFKFKFLPSFQTAWKHIKIETKGSCQKLHSFDIYLKTFSLKKNLLEIKTFIKKSSSLYW